MHVISPNFHLEDFACHDGTAVPEELVANVYKLVLEVLQPLRYMWAGPLIVICGYRTPQHNVAVGGALGSAHLEAMAADIRPESAAAVDNLHAMALANWTSGKLPALGGLGHYPERWIHVDTRKAADGHLRRWEGNRVGSEPPGS